MRTPFNAVIRFDARSALSAALLLLQLVLSGAVPFADTGVDAAAGENGAHVEAGTSPCPTSHNHEQCQFCRHLATTLLNVAAAERSPAASCRFLQARPASDAFVIAGALVGTHGARAPPAL